jgi:hypothetical protein
MPMSLRSVLAVVLCALACAQPEPGAAARSPAARAAPLRCTRVAGPEVGRLPLEVDVGGRTVRLQEWTQVDERSTAVVGFAAQLPADVSYTVHAGEGRYRAQSPRWLHPEGVAGPRVHGIDAIDFCRPAATTAAPGPAASGRGFLQEPICATHPSKGGLRHLGEST